MDERCSHIREQLSEYLDGRLPGDWKEEVDAHLKTCDDCRVALHQLRDLSAQMKSEPLLTPPESFYQGVLARIEDAKPRANDFWGWPVKALATMGVLMIIVITTKEVRQKKEVVTRDRVAEKQLSDLVSQMRTEIAQNAPAAPTEPELPRDQRLDKSMKVPPPALNEVFEGADEEMISNKKEARQEFDRSNDLAASVAQGVGVSQNFVGSRVPAYKPAAPEAIGKLRAKGDVVLGRKAKDNEFREAKASVPTSTPWRGVVSGMHQPYTAAIKTAQEWTAFWKTHSQSFGTPPALPAVDFSKNMVAVIMMGEQPTTGYGIEIVRTLQTPTVLMVEYRAITPPPGIPQSSVITYPYELRVLPRTDVPVVFRLLPEE